MPKKEQGYSDNKVLPDGSWNWGFLKIEWREFVPKQKNKTSVESHLGSQSSVNQTESLEECQTEVSRNHKQLVGAET